MGTLFAFIGVSIILIVTPGPDTATTIRNTLLGGRIGGVLTGLGVATGQLAWTLATSAGLAALVAASEPLFLAIKYAGSAYLVFLGVQALWSAFSPSGNRPGATGQVPGRKRLGAMAAFRQGFVSNIGNPKMAVFFPSVLTQFLPGAPAFLPLLGFGAIFALMTFAWLSIYAVLITRLGAALGRSSVRRSIEGVTGAVLIGLGLRLAIEPR